MKPWYLKFDCGTWLKDPALTRCNPSTRGVWIDLLSVMHELDRSGVLRGTIEEFSRFARCSTVQLTHALTDLQTTGAADVTERNGIVTLVCRKMNREYNQREANRLRVSRYREKCDCNEPSLNYNSDSERVEVGKGSGEREERERFDRPTAAQCELYAAKIGLPMSEVAKFIDYYESKGWKVGKTPMKNWQAAMRNWKRNWEASRGNINGYKTAAEKDLERVLKGV